MCPDETTLAVRLRAAFGEDSARGLTVATAESVTAGRVQALLTGASGSSAYFVGGLTAYAAAQKVRLLGVDAAEAARDGAVSETVALQMARGARQLFATDLGVATTGWAEPAPAAGVARPFAWIAVAGLGEHVVAERVEPPTGLNRSATQAWIAAAAAERLLAVLKGLAPR